MPHASGHAVAGGAVMDGFLFRSDEDALKAEAAAPELFRAFVRENASVLSYIAGWGDGKCGYMTEILQEELLPSRTDTPSRPSKKRISRNLAKQVFERDAYRCVRCGSHIDLTCDHVIPESKGGPTTFENLQTMCRPCNCRKGVGE